MKKALTLSAIVMSFALAGCNGGGTTYGTGVSHEEQTVKALSNVFAFKNDEQPNIDYSARPDLVMPPDNGQLPQPLDVEQSTSNADWPETPEQRIARVRGEAVEADKRSGELPLEEMRREKYGIGVAGPVERARSARADRGGNDFIDMLRDGEGKSESEELKRRRAELAYSTGPQRKYLTEPPVEYRTPAATAVAGDLGYDPEEVKKLEEEEARKARANELGMWTE